MGNEETEISQMSDNVVPESDKAIHNENINISDKVRKRRKVVIDWECVNSECRVTGSNSNNSVKTASSHVVAFYGQAVKKNSLPTDSIKTDIHQKRKVCLPCEKRANNAQDRMLESLVSGEYILKDKLFPTTTDFVDIEDSDEEPVDDTSSESELEFELDSDDDLDGKKRGSDVNLELQIEEVLKTLNFKDQIEDSIKSFNQRLDDLSPDYDATDKAFKKIEDEVDKMREEFYQPFRPIPKFLDPLDLNEAELKESAKDISVRPSQSSIMPSNLPEVESTPVSTSSATQQPANLPAVGKLERPEPKSNEKVFVIGGNVLNVWKVATVVEAINSHDDETKYKVRVETVRSAKATSSTDKTLPRKQLAYYSPATVRLQVGTRIIGVYRDSHKDSEENNDGTTSNDEFYSGVIAEPPKAMNKYRYLVFFDDGYASYINHADIRVVCKQTETRELDFGVWDDVHPNSREFIKKYMIQYPERPMVRLVQGQTVRAEWEGSWWYTKVDEVDASLAKLTFHVNGRKECIYRGSTRLEPLYVEMQQQKKRAEQLNLIKKERDDGKSSVTSGRYVTRNKNDGFKGSGPYVEYTKQVELDSPSKQEPQSQNRAVAKKSTGQKHSSQNVISINDHQSERQGWDKRGIVQPATVHRNEGQVYMKHDCKESCLADIKYQYQQSKMLGTNPLLIPIILGWLREVARYKNYGRRAVYYVSPCGRRLRSLPEVHKYLIMTNSRLEIDFFNFEWYVRLYNEFEPEREFYRIQDISYGKENFAVSCVNSLDKNYPEYVEYSKIRLPQANVNINTDKDFLVSCDCDDDCQDKSKCNCCQLTIQNTDTAPGMKGRTDPKVGYVYRRLKENVPSGIFECNNNCTCKSTCLNRVAQNPLRVRLQVFKTGRRGWGLRTLNDIPAGGFICIYVGNLYNNDEANRQGQDFGDEYFAELDMIESVEGRKEGYESDVPEDDIEVMSDGFDENENKKEEPTEKKNKNKKDKNKKLILTKAQSRHENHFDAPKQTVKHTSTRKYFGVNEDVFIMDAKSIGNVGRYLNHSCNPNIFVQNCFVDTHDLRFPWVAFFASVHIPAGQELCWDYQYIVDQVEGKEIYCQCGSDNCRGRLL